jgi:hypothetical protein
MPRLTWTEILLFVFLGARDDSGQHHTLPLVQMGGGSLKLCAWAGLKP